jgi:hypothetical protein
LGERIWNIHPDTNDSAAISLKLEDAFVVLTGTSEAGEALEVVLGEAVEAAEIMAQFLAEIDLESGLAEHHIPR